LLRFVWLKNHPLVKNYLLDTQTAFLKTVYFDTVEQTLKKQAIALRIRRTEKGKYIQGVKQGLIEESLVTGCQKRLEWEEEVPMPQIYYDRLPAVIRPLLQTVHLKPIFETILDRQIWNISYKGMVAELAFDMGTIFVPSLPNQKQLVSELEIELKSGDVSVLIEYVQQLQKELQLEPESQTKSARGYALYEMLNNYNSF
jgi:inorganic triphosphatase YgiF